MADLPVLITGGAGFIGSHLAEALLAAGRRVRVLDNLSAGKRSNLPDDRRLELIEGDVGDLPTVRAALQGCASVVHLAAVASVQASVEDPLGTHRSNLIGTLNLCQAMSETGVRRVVFASSAAVYGDNAGPDGAVGEDTPTSPLTPYAADKLASEHYLDFYRRQHGLEPRVFRFFNIYGPRQDPNSPYSGVISIFAEHARRGLPITVFGDGEQTRDFYYVGDLVQLLLQALAAEGCEPGAVNVGLDRATSLNALLATFGELLGGLPPIRHAAPRPGDIRHSRADNRRLLARYQVPTPTALRDGLARLLASCADA